MIYALRLQKIKKPSLSFAPSILQQQKGQTLMRGQRAWQLGNQMDKVLKISVARHFDRLTVGSAAVFCRESIILKTYFVNMTIRDNLGRGKMAG